MSQDTDPAIVEIAVDSLALDSGNEVFDDVVPVDNGAQVENIITQSVDRKLLVETISSESPNKLWLKIGAPVVAGVAAATMWLTLKPVDSETPVAGDEPLATAPANPGEATTANREEILENLTLDDMLKQFVDEYGMPNRKIEIGTSNPEDFVSILYHNAACAINTRDVACADNIYFNDNNPSILIGTIAKFADSDMFVQVDINEIISVETNELGEIEVLVNVTDNILIKTPTFEGHRDDTSLERLTLVKLADGTLANTLVVVVQNLDDD